MNVYVLCHELKGNKDWIFEHVFATLQSAKGYVYEWVTLWEETPYGVQSEWLGEINPWYRWVILETEVHK